MTPEDLRLGRALRALRHRRHLRQVDVAAAAGVSQGIVSRAEHGRVGGMTVDTVRALCAAVGARLGLLASWNGAALDRLLDERHAALVEGVAKRLRARGWTVVAEVSFSHFGERGAFDLLAWHAGTRSLLVVEVKTEVGAIEATLRTLDVKVRLAAGVARERFGWAAVATSRLVVFPEDRTMRRHLERHATTISSVLPLRGRDVRAWIRTPSGAMGGVWFLADISPRCRSGVRRRVRAA